MSMNIGSVRVLRRTFQLVWIHEKNQNEMVPMAQGHIKDIKGGSLYTKLQSPESDNSTKPIPKKGIYSAWGLRIRGWLVRSCHQGLMMRKRRRNPSSPMDHSQRTPTIQDGVVLWMAEPGAEERGLGEPYIVVLPGKEQLGQKGNWRWVQQRPTRRICTGRL